MKQYFTLVFESIIALFTSRFDTTVTRQVVKQPEKGVMNEDIASLLSVYILAILITLFIGM